MRSGPIAAELIEGLMQLKSAEDQKQMKRSKFSFDNFLPSAGTFSHALAPERLGPHIAKRVLWRADTAEKVVALSFDDGPNPVYTPEILKILAEFGIPATFFLVGRHVEKYGSIARDVKEQQHEIGNHTFNHKMMPFLNDAEIETEVSRTHASIQEKTGSTPRYLRPPMGLFTKRTVTKTAKEGYKTIVGDVYPRDPGKPGKKRLVQRILRRVKPGSVIILHDGGNTKNVDRSQTVACVKEIIPNLLEKGYRFSTLTGMFGTESSAQP